MRIPMLKLISLMCFLAASSAYSAQSNHPGINLDDRHWRFDVQLSPRLVATNEVEISTVTTKMPEHPDWWQMSVLIGSLLLSVLCLVRLWRRSDSPVEKIFWTVVVFLPVIGPLFFAAFFRSPSALPTGEQASVNPSASAFYAGGGGLGR